MYVWMDVIYIFMFMFIFRVYGNMQKYLYDKLWKFRDIMTA